jgi:hypothetical protein
VVVRRIGMRRRKREMSAGEPPGGTKWIDACVKCEDE